MTKNTVVNVATVAFTLVMAAVIFVGASFIKSEQEFQQKMDNFQAQVEIAKAHTPEPVQYSYVVVEQIKK